MKKVYKRIITLLIVLVAAAAAWYFIIRKPEEPITLQTAKPERGYIAQSVTATGKIEPEDTVAVGTQVSGIIRYLYADFNSKVKKGQLIAELDKSLLQATLDQYKGNLQNAESQLVFQENNFNRQNQLYKVEAISKADYDSAVNSYNAAKSNVATVKAQVRQAAKNLAYADIYSSIDGVVLNRNISIGQTVAASFSTPTLFIIAKDITRMQVQANVDEADIGDVKAADRATFTVDAFINDQFNGTVKEIRLHPSVSANVVTYTTIINAPNNDMKLKPGMTANIIIYTKEVNNTLLIPVKALTFTPDSSLLSVYQIEGQASGKRMTTPVRGNGGSNNAAIHIAKSRKDNSGAPKQKATVWVLQGKKIVKKRIVTGLNDNLQVEVLSGLAENDVVITGVTGGNTSTGTAKPGGSPFLPQRRSSGSSGNRGGR
ncbi:MAG: efflux RND transporter periplasmic adaptor subunit [Bacteroidetes bacterium]|nr:efflux RND transporter periplasmic adaptor subunit [Bacteroidota bacterium]